MQLSVHHLCHYLNHGLKMQMLRGGGVVHTGTLTMLRIDKLCENPEKGSIDFKPMESLNTFRPILRPMSSLEGSATDIDRMGLITRADLALAVTNPFDLNWEQIQYLFENHYDVFGLIPAGLAISKAEVVYI